MEYQIFRRIFDLLPYQAERYPKQNALGDKYGYYSTIESIDIVNQLSAYWIKKGLSKSDKIVFIAENGCPQWIFFDMSIMQIGAISIPIHAYYNEEEYVFIFDQLQAKYFVIQNEQYYEKVKSYIDKKKVISIEPIEGIVHWKSLLEDVPDDIMEYINLVNKTILSSDIAMIMYTSGATGMPKGVVLTHENMISNIKSVMALMPIKNKHQTVSYLPISHVFERMIIYLYIAVGAKIFFIHDRKALFQQIKIIKPHYMTAVPRILEKFYDYLRFQAGEESFLKKKVIYWAMDAGKQESDNILIKPIIKFKHILAYLLVYRKWKSALGGKLKAIGVGAAALDPNIGKLFSKAGVRVREGYGLTETSPVITFNRFTPGGVRYGTVGQVIPGVQVKLIDQNKNGEGEILVKGPNVMKEYYKNKALTIQKLGPDKWFKTGDVGKFVGNDYLKITDRKKNIFKTSSGKYVAPQRIENKLKLNNFIDQCMITGFQKPYITALIIPEFDCLKRYCSENNIHWTSDEYMHINPKVMEYYDEIIDKVNSQLKAHERIKKTTLLPGSWSIESGEYTPSLKLKRNVILNKYAKQIKKMYE